MTFFIHSIPQCILTHKTSSFNIMVPDPKKIIKLVAVRVESFVTTLPTLYLHLILSVSRSHDLKYGGTLGNRCEVSFDEISCEIERPS